MVNKKIIRELFPVGFYDDIHPDFSVNFQMNRCYNWANDKVSLNEMREAINQLFEQSKTLTNVRSLATRMFTRKENAQNHCQLGNIGLSLEVILNWIEQVMEEQS